MEPVNQERHKEDYKPNDKHQKLFLIALVVGAIIGIVLMYVALQQR